MASGIASPKNGHAGRSATRTHTLRFAILPALPARKPQTQALLQATHTPLRIFRAAPSRIIHVHYAPIALNTSEHIVQLEMGNLIQITGDGTKNTESDTMLSFFFFSGGASFKPRRRSWGGGGRGVRSQTRRGRKRRMQTQIPSLASQPRNHHHQHQNPPRPLPELRPPSPRQHP